MQGWEHVKVLEEMRYIPLSERWESTKTYENEAFSLSCCPGEHPIRRKANETWNSDFWQIDTATSNLCHRRIMPTSVWWWRCNAFWIGDCVWLRHFGGKCGQYCKFNLPSVPRSCLMLQSSPGQKRLTALQLYGVRFFFTKKRMTRSCAQVQRLRRMAFFEPFWKRLLGALSNM